MENRHDDFGCRAPLFRVNVYRNAAPVIRDGDRLIGMNSDCYDAAMAGKGLVDGVVDNLENHVVQPGSVIGIPDVHSRSFSNCFKAL